MERGKSEVVVRLRTIAVALDLRRDSSDLREIQQLKCALCEQNLHGRIKTLQSKIQFSSASVADCWQAFSGFTQLVSRQPGVKPSAMWVLVEDQLVPAQPNEREHRLRRRVCLYSGDTLIRRLLERRFVVRFELPHGRCCTLDFIAKLFLDFPGLVAKLF